jgi:hypothetical protein
MELPRRVSSKLLRRSGRGPGRQGQPALGGRNAGAHCRVGAVGRKEPMAGGAHAWCGGRSSMGARSPARMWAVGRNEPAAGGARLHEGRAAWRAELVGGARRRGWGLRQSTEVAGLFVFFSSFVKSRMNWIIIFLLSYEIHNPTKSKSNDILLLKSNWIWITVNPLPGISISLVTTG